MRANDELKPTFKPCTGRSTSSSRVALPNLFKRNVKLLYHQRIH